MSGEAVERLEFGKDWQKVFVREGYFQGLIGEGDSLTWTRNSISFYGPKEGVYRESFPPDTVRSLYGKGVDVAVANERGEPVLQVFGEVICFSLINFATNKADLMSCVVKPVKPRELEEVE